MLRSGHFLGICCVVQCFVLGYAHRLGHLGLYHPSNSVVFATPGVPANASVQEAFGFGTAAIMSNETWFFKGHEVTEGSFSDRAQALCASGGSNQVWGMLLPPSEGGVIDNKEDTGTWTPKWPSGLIQSAQRFSELRNTCLQVMGAVIDDFWSNWQNHAITKDDLVRVRAALKGHPVDPNGWPIEDAVGTTPDLKLIVVVYNGQLSSFNWTELEGVVDGVSYWMWEQNTNYPNFTETFRDLKAQLPPNATITVGDYTSDSHEGAALPAGVNSILSNALDLYDSGDLDGIWLFSGPFMSPHAPVLTQADWDALGLYNTLEQTYWPRLGGVDGRVEDSSTGLAIADALVEPYRGTRLITRQLTNQTGDFSFGAWEGTQTVAVTKTGYLPATVQIDVTGGQDAHLTVKLTRG